MIAVMSRSSAPRGVPPKTTLSGGLSGEDEAVILHPDFTGSDESIRVLLRKHLPHGVKTEIAELAGIHANQLSRQLSGDDGLHNKTVGAALHVLGRYPELHSVIAAVQILRNGDAIELREKTGIVIEFSNGQTFFPGMRPK